jgi:peptide/nickel transport system permease protein
MSEAGPRGLPTLRASGPARLALAGCLVVVGLILLALLAPVVAPGSPTEIASDRALRGPTVAEPFGMDDLGRSVLSRVVHAYRVSLGVALTSVALALLVGGPLGLVAGYAEGVPDQLIMRPLDVLMAFPGILLAIALMSVFGTGVTLVSAALAVVYTPVVARVVRAAVLAAKVEVYVDGARALGATATRVVLRHILPNAATPVLVQASVLMAIAILVEAALSFLGVGVRPPTPSLGLMLADGRGFMVQAPWMVVCPGLAIMAAVLGFNMLADGLRDWLDPERPARL